MSSAPNKQEHPESVFLYALRALPSSEASIVGGHIASCADCRQEFETLRAVVDSFVAWPTDVLRPSTSLWDRLSQRIAAETGAGPVPAPERSAEPDWKEAAPGIAVKLLATDTGRNRVTMLVRLAPGAHYPPHRHAGLEELYMLEGELVVNDKRLYPGDYLRSEESTEDHLVWSDTGCAGVLITSYRDVLF
jgi:anti-sigma factor ChrR (cupin superfamily)